MRMRALLLAAVLALSPLGGLAGEKQIVDVKELAGSWRGWVNEVAGDEWATMNVAADGSYKATTFSVTTVGKFYLQAGKLRYRSSRTTPLAMPSAEVFGTASVSEEKGKAVLTLIPEDPNYLGRAEFEQVRSKAYERDGHHVETPPRREDGRCAPRVLGRRFRRH
jgi:hypothetical protein